MPTTPSESVINNLFDKFWENASLFEWIIGPKVRSEIQQLEKDLVEDLQGYLDRHEWEEEWKDIKDEVDDEGYWRGHQEGENSGYDLGYEKAKAECENCSQ
jgi:hypothetical protein